MKKTALLMIAPAILIASHINPLNKINKTEFTKKKELLMHTKDYTATITVDKSPAVAYTAIKNFRGWWSEEIEGNTDKLNETFFYHHKTIHLCKIKLIEMVPDKKLVYQVMENEFSFTKDKSEWVNTKLVFEISNEDGKTKVKFTHEGLVPEYECYEVCNDAWSIYIKKSLYDFITTGKGQPNPKEGEGINAQLDKKWKLTEQNKENKTPMKKENYMYSFKSSKSSEDIFKLLLDVRQWWSGLYEEKITGKSDQLNEEFDYSAGGGIHYSKQKLVEVIPDKKIVWLVTDSKLTFLKDTSEWTGTKIHFDLAKDGDKTLVTFTHEGLVPQIECFNQCSDGWKGYLVNLEKKLK